MPSSSAFGERPAGHSSFMRLLLAFGRLDATCYSGRAQFRVFGTMIRIDRVHKWFSSLTQTYAKVDAITSDSLTHVERAEPVQVSINGPARGEMAANKLAWWYTTQTLPSFLDIFPCPKAPIPVHGRFCAVSPARVDFTMSWQRRDSGKRRNLMLIRRDNN